MRMCVSNASLSSGFVIKEENKNMALMLLLSRVRQRMPSVMIVEAVIVPMVGTLPWQQMSPLRVG